MAAVLGISAHYHDAAAALVVDGRIVAAQQEERLSRVKNDPSLPRQAIDACLALGGLRGPDLDRVVFYENPYRKLERILVGALGAFPRGARFFRRALRDQLGDKLWVLDELAAHCGVPRARVDFVAHHASHAASALDTAPFGEAVALTIDGVGEAESTAIWRPGPGGPEALTALEHPHSLGLFYAAITAFLGFRVNEGEYKVMGLAAFGEPRFREALDRMVTLHDDGAFTLRPDAFGDHLRLDRAYGDAMVRALGPPRDPHRPWDLEATADRHYADVAASAQDLLEDAVLGLARAAHRRSGARHLVLAGGVALNCRANARVLAEGPFGRVYVHPAAGDAGGALGAALLGARQLGDTPDPGSFTPALGVRVDPGHTAAVAAHLGLRGERVADPAADAAARLAEGAIVAWVQGRAEWGPRALGQRSLLTRADDESLRDVLNRRIKGREPFRPFAPAVRTAHAAALFEGAPNDMTPTMTTVCRVAGEGLAGATHVDGTARVQTVEPGGALDPLLEALERDHGLRAVLHTSLNAAGEPLVARGTDALDFFVRRKPDVLYVEDLRITR
ncbi:MAG: carbamoyl transferase [Sandaracinus sp.]|nr:carbamoyl transferase [Sandaracinus sp.]